MKTFKEFIVEAINIEVKEIISILLEAKGPDYSDEHAQINLYNYLVGSGDRRRKLGREVRAAIASGDNERVREIATRELESSQNDPSHPLHFNNADPTGFGSKGKTAAHQPAYLERMQRALPGFLAQVQSRAGRSIASQGYRGEVKGGEHMESEPGWQGNPRGQGRADYEYRSKDNPKAVHRASGKDDRGSQAYSAGGSQFGAMLRAAGETVARGMMTGARPRKNPGESEQEYRERLTAIKLANREKARQARADIASRADEVGTTLDDTRGTSVQQQRDVLPGVSSSASSLETDYPGITRAMDQEAITGRRQFGNRGRVHSVHTTGTDASFVDPRQQSVKTPRPRAGKGTGRPAAVSGDIAPAKTTKKQQQARQSDYLTFSRSSGSI